MEENEKKWPRQPNQHRMLYDENQLTEGAERLLELIKKYNHVHNVTVQQYSYLMGISRRKTIKYITELVTKGRIKIHPESRKRGAGKANIYEIIDDSSQ